MSQPDAASSSRARDIAYYLGAIAVGAVTGLLGTLLHLGVNHLFQWPQLLRAHTGVDDRTFLIMAAGICAAMVLLPVWLVRTFAPEASGSGVQEIEGAMEGCRKVRWVRVLPVKFFGGLLSLGSGLVLGREGPTIHIGASVAQVAAQGLRLGESDNRGLLGAGAAAGLAAAFNAPQASILFVIEETRRQFPYSTRTYSGVILAAIMSAIVTQMIAGRAPFMEMAVPEMPFEALPAFALLGIVLGVAGVVFNRGLVWSLDRALAFGRRTSFYILPALLGVAVGLLAVVLPAATRGGEELAVLLVAANPVLAVVAVLVVVRFVMTLASYASGVPGGIFAPILVLGTTLGLLFARCLELAVALPDGATAALAVAAMGGLFSSTVRSPLVGVVLIVELTGTYHALLPTLIASVFAYFVAAWLGGRPIYEVLLERTLRIEAEARRATGPQDKAGAGAVRETIAG